MPTLPHQPAPSSPTLCAIGNFDGVHRGHVGVLRSAQAEARVHGLRPIVLTFDPHPLSVVGRPTPALLTPLERKIALIQRQFPDFSVVVKRFDEELAALSPDSFAQRILVKELLVREVVVGENFRFGRDRIGDLPMLAAIGAQRGFVARPKPIFGDEVGAWSSTRVRAAIEHGRWEEVSQVLGRPHAVSGLVVCGHQRGRTIGFPTANLEGVLEALPPRGVYAVLVDLLDEAGKAQALGKGVANFGVRPTLEAGPSIEAHVFDFQGDLYGKQVRLHLVCALREERKFAGLPELQRQIEADATRARSALASLVPDPAAEGSWF